MTHILQTTRKQRRRSALFLLFLWVWCLAAGAAALTMGPLAPDYLAPDNLVPDYGAVDLISETAHSQPHHSAMAQEVGQTPSTMTSECCPETDDLLSAQLAHASLLPVALTFFIMLIFPALREGTASHFWSLRLVPVPPRRLHVLHCTYLN